MYGGGGEYIQFNCIEKVLVVKINLAWKGGKPKCPMLWELLFGLKMEIKTRNSLSTPLWKPFYFILFYGEEKQKKKNLKRKTC